MNISIRRVLCVLLVCLVLCSTCLEPVRADAAAIATATIIGLGTSETIAAILIGIGVTYTSYELFKSLVSDISFSIPSDFLIGTSSGKEYIKAVKYNDTCFVPKKLISWTQDCLWGCENTIAQSYETVFENVTPVPNDYVSYDDILAHIFSGRSYLIPCAERVQKSRYCYTVRFDKNCDIAGLYCWADEPPTFEFTDSGVRVNTTPSGIIGYYSPHILSDGSVAGASCNATSTCYIAGAKTARLATNPGTATYKPVSAGLSHTASFSPSIDTDYETWIKTGIWIVLPDESETGGSGEDGDNDNNDGEDKPLWLPLRPGTDVEEAGQLTQDEVQSGTGYIGTEYETDASVGVGHDDYFEYNGKQVDWPELELSPPPVFETFSIQTIIEFLQWFWQQLLTVLKWIGSCIKLLPMQLVYDLQYCLQWLLDALTTVLSKLSDLLKPLMDYLLEGIKAIFVPSTDFITAKVQSLRARFSWIDPFITFAENISGELFSAEPPVIYIHLDDAEGSYNYGGTIPFLDMRWYARYKAQGDLILSGFLWALFAWRIYLKLPGIINGASGTLGHITSFSRRDDD